MELVPGSSLLTSLPRDVLLDLLLSIPASSVVNFYLVNKTHLKLFDQHGLWEFLARGIYKWSTIGGFPRSETAGSYNEGNQMNAIWKKEFRMASYIREKLGHSHFRATESENEVIIAKNSVKVVQGDTTLYPLPIGNFTTAYFEVELSPCSESNPLGTQAEVSIGGALYGYSSRPGMARSSYGINSASDVFLECEYSTLPHLTTPFEQGDISTGLGINFATDSVFFTKNGNLVHETAKNAYELPLQNLMNLYPTISLLGGEVKVNCGSHPFAFDLLKYQQRFKNESQPVILYSEIIVQHLISLPDEDIATRAWNTHFLDKNYPNERIQLPHYAYLLVYCKPHPESKAFVDPNELVNLNSLRMVLSFRKIFEKLPLHQTKQAEEILRQVAPIIEENYIDFESQPWQNKLVNAENALQFAYHDQYMQYVALYADELIEYNDGDHLDDHTTQLNDYLFSRKILGHSNCLPNIRPLMMRLITVFDGEIDDDHWVIQALWPMLDPQNTCQSHSDLYKKCIIDLLKLRMVGHFDVIFQRHTQHLEAMIKECEIMKKISCNDEMIEESFQNVIEFLTEPRKPILESKRRPSDPFGPISAQLDLQQLSILMSQPQTQNLPETLEEIPKSVLYGVYKLKIPVHNFRSAREYLNHVWEENRKLVTNELKIEYLESVIATRADLDREDILFGPLCLLFGFVFDKNAPIEKLREDVKYQLEERIAKYRGGQ